LRQQLYVVIVAAQQFARAANVTGERAEAGREAQVPLLGRAVPQVLQLGGEQIVQALPHWGAGLDCLG